MNSNKHNYNIDMCNNFIKSKMQKPKDDLTAIPGGLFEPRFWVGAKLPLLI